jgi:hypothetical protein
MKLTKTFLLSALAGFAFFTVSCGEDTKEKAKEAAGDDVKDAAAADAAAADAAAAAAAAADAAAAAAADADAAE